MRSRIRTIAPASFLARGDIAGLLNWHRSRAADLRMEDAGGDGGQGGTGSGDGGQGGAPPADAGGDGGQGAPAFKPPASQDELDRIISERLNRQKAQYRDYDDVKAKAAKLDELEAANATELEKITKRAEEAESTAKAATTRALKAEIRSRADGFADRQDAVLRLADADGGLDRFINESGDIDSEAVARELKEVLKDHPHLADAALDDDKDKDKGGGTTHRPLDKLRPGAAPAADKHDAPATLGSAVAQHYAKQ